jgi:hypothetical protein
MLAQDKFTQVNAVLGRRLMKNRSPAGAARTGQKDFPRTECFVSGHDFSRAAKASKNQGL